MRTCKIQFVINYRLLESQSYNVFFIYKVFTGKIRLFTLTISILKKIYHPPSLFWYLLTFPKLKSKVIDNNNEKIRCIEYMYGKFLVFLNIILLGERSDMEYSVKRIDVKEESLLEITRFLKETFPRNKKFTLEFVRWQYAQNPLGQMEGFNAWDGDRIVSHFAGMPFEMNLFEKKRKGLLCINVSTNIHYRGKKLFTAVGEKTVEYAKENGFDFLMAVPNGNSTHGFLKYFGFYLVSQLSAKVGFGNHIYSAKDFNCLRMWDTKQWEWRLSNPANQYAYDKEGIIFTPISFFAKTLSTAGLPQNIIDTKFRNIGMRPLNLYVGLGADTSKGVYFDIPSFVKRPPFNLVFKDLRGDIPLIKKEDIFLQLIDLDTV